MLLGFLPMELTRDGLATKSPSAAFGLAGFVVLRREKRFSNYFFSMTADVILEVVEGREMNEISENIEHRLHRLANTSNSEHRKMGRRRMAEGRPPRRWKEETGNWPLGARTPALGGCGFRRARTYCRQDAGQHGSQVSAVWERAKDFSNIFTPVTMDVTGGLVERRE